MTLEEKILKRIYEIQQDILNSFCFGEKKDEIVHNMYETRKLIDKTFEHFQSTNEVEKVLYSTGHKALAVKSYVNRTGHTFKVSKSFVFDSLEKRG